MNEDFWMQFFLDAKIEKDFASKYAEIFIAHEIGPSNLHLLNQVYLDAMEIKPLGHVMSILDQIEKRLSVPMSEQRWQRSEAPGGGYPDERQKCSSPCSYSSPVWETLCRSCSMKITIHRLYELQRPINTDVSRNPGRNRIRPVPRARSNSECSSDRPSFLKALPRVGDMPTRNQLDSLTIPYHQSRPSISLTVPRNPGGTMILPPHRIYSNPEISRDGPPLMKALPRVDDMPIRYQPDSLTVPYYQSRPSTSFSVPRNPGGNRLSPVYRTYSNPEISSGRPPFFKVLPRVDDLPIRNQPDPLTVPYFQRRPSTSSTVPRNPGGNRMSSAPGDYSNPEISNERPPIFKGLPRVDDMQIRNQPDPLNLPYHQSRPTISSTVPRNPGGNRMSTAPGDYSNPEISNERAPIFKGLPRVDDMPIRNQPDPLNFPYHQRRPTISSTLPRNPGGNRMSSAPGDYSNPEISNERPPIFKSLPRVDDMPIRNQPDPLNLPYHQSRPSTSSTVPRNPGGNKMSSSPGDYSNPEISNERSPIFKGLPRVDDMPIRNQPDLPYHQSRPSTSSTVPRNPGGNRMSSPPRNFSNPEISNERSPIFKGLPRVDDMPIRNQPDPLNLPYHQSRPSTSSTLPRNPGGTMILPPHRTYSNPEISSGGPSLIKALPRVDDMPILKQPDPLTLPYHQSRPSTSSIKEIKKEHLEYNWKLCQTKEKIQRLKNEKIPNSGNENSIEEPFMNYFRHRAVSMKIEMQEEMEAISNRKPIASFSGKGCLKGGSETFSGGRKKKLVQNNTDMYTGKEDVPLRVGFRSGGPEVKMISPADKVPAFHSKLEKGNLHFRSHLRRDRCLTLLSISQLEELNTIFSDEIGDSNEAWP